MTTIPTDAQETGHLLALLVRRTNPVNSHHETLIDPELAHDLITTLTTHIDTRAACQADLIDGASNFTLQRRPAAQPDTSNPSNGRWSSIDGYEAGQRDFEYLAALTQTDQLTEPSDSLQSPPPAHQDAHRTPIPRSGPHHDPKAIHEQRAEIREMDIAQRTAYLMGVLAAAQCHFDPPPF